MGGRIDHTIRGELDSMSPGDKPQSEEVTATARIPDCVDIEKRFGQRYRVGYEDQAHAATQDPWHKIVICKAGHICPAGGTKLWACTNGRRSKAAQNIIAGDLPCEIKMDGDDGINAEFDVSDYKLFFNLMGAKRR